MNRNPEDNEFEPIPDNVELDQDAQQMFDEMDATFDDDDLINRINPAK